MERIKERDDIMRNNQDFDSENNEMNNEKIVAGTDKVLEDKTDIADFDIIAESISNKIDENAADVMEEAIKEIKADEPNFSNDADEFTDSMNNRGGLTDSDAERSQANGRSSSASNSAGAEKYNIKKNESDADNIKPVENGMEYSGQTYYGNMQSFIQQAPYPQQGNIPPYPQQNINGGIQGPQQQNMYNQQMYYNLPQNPYGNGYSQYGYYVPPYLQQNYGGNVQQPGGGQQSVQNGTQNQQRNGAQNSANQANHSGQYPPNYQPGGWYNYGAYNQNVPNYYGYPSPYQQYGNYNQAYGSGQAANAARLEDIKRGTARRGAVKRPKPKNVGLRVFVCILAVVILAGITLTSAYFVFSTDEKNVLDNSSPSTSYSVGSSRLEASASSEFTGGQSVDVSINSVPESEKMSTAEIAEKMIPSVVGIMVYSSDSGSATSLATGVIITEDGYIATNDHIYDNIPNAEFVVITSDNKRYEAAFVAGDSRSDLAVLKMKGASGLKYAEFGDSDNIKVGEEVVVIGNPYSMTLSSSVTKGIISATNRRLTGNSTYTMKLIQTDAAINPGNSGGPLVNSYGQVIGINSSKIQQSGYEGIGFAIPSATVKSVVESLIENGYVTGRAKLGITFQVIDFLTAERNNIPQGLYVLSVSQESGLSNKIYEGEIITHLDGVSLSEAADFMDIIEAKKPGDTLAIRTYNTSKDMYNDVDAVLTEDRGESSYR